MPNCSVDYAHTPFQSYIFIIYLVPSPFWSSDFRDQGVVHPGRKLGPRGPTPSSPNQALN